MGNVLRPAFGAKRAILKGFIPDDLGQNALEIAEQRRRTDIFIFAKTGQPTYPIPEETEGPDVA